MIVLDLFTTIFADTDCGSGMPSAMRNRDIDAEFIGHAQE